MVKVGNESFPANQTGCYGRCSSEGTMRMSSGLDAGQWQPGDEASTKAGAAEHMLLGALIELYHDARENDVRLGILRITLQSLQRHGKARLLALYLAKDSTLHSMVSQRTFIQKD